MKAYLFDTKSGVYGGESFAEPAMLEYENGITLEPPPDYGHGQVPVFDRREKRWTVIPLSRARQLLAASPAGNAERTNESL